MGGILRLRRLTRANSLFIASLAIAAPMLIQQARGSEAAVAAALPEPTVALADGELRQLDRLADWVDPNAKASAKLADAIRKDPESFSLFAGYHDERERQTVLAEVPYGEQIAKAAAKHEVDSLLVAAVVEVESTFDPEAGSHKGAVGLMQLLPSTAGMSRDRLMNPTTNLDAGAEYLREMLQRFDGDLELALAAYNAGPTNVRRYGGVPPFTETQQYVEKVLSRYVGHHRELWQRNGGAELIAFAS